MSAVCLGPRALQGRAPAAAQNAPCKLQNRAAGEEEARLQHPRVGSRDLPAATSPGGAGGAMQSLESWCQEQVAEWGRRAAQAQRDREEAEREEMFWKAKACRLAPSAGSRVAEPVPPEAKRPTAGKADAEGPSVSAGTVRALGGA
eukprot:CAMPEP_0179265702 /NCGR_PEP_ID=MMETSP0797-20121207/29039_1 /TAXON_ID=47934 /ORGANISM="Dinophysis acuminata, Strain DAEP01" /LENGTH=145 /DNA_ID=CAMNT_0020973917 /DNA_START=31 /DNA_END=468 /DNA_ORIENTATION=+